MIAVGLCFLPFAKAFHTPMFTMLGSLMFVIGVVGLGIGSWRTANAAAASAVATGVAMLVAIAADAARSAPHGPNKSLLLRDREADQFVGVGGPSAGFFADGVVVLDAAGDGLEVVVGVGDFWRCSARVRLRVSVHRTRAHRRRNGGRQQRCRHQ